MELEFLIIIALLIWLLVKNDGDRKALEARLKRTEFQLERIAEKVGVREHPVNERLRQLKEEGKNVEAVKEAREQFGYSLVEAKKYVDEL
ncbi:hypothetical protein [Lentibacillus sediminis]|uniref:hypothetical protein n=1 Tax=Lentibacillus sediminis TaxID=1940529 RepID=UPI001EFC73AF|nr:hypothetical protein [Lentibacillus sediminis]